MKIKNSILLFIYFISFWLSIPGVKANPVPMVPINDIFIILPLMLLFFPVALVVEFIVFYIALKKDLAMEKFNLRDLSKAIVLMNLLTFPLAQVFRAFFIIILSFFYSLIYGVLLIELIVILLESIFLAEMLNKAMEEMSPDSWLSNYKIIGAVCVANIISMLAGFLPSLMFF